MDQPCSGWLMAASVKSRVLSLRLLVPMLGCSSFVRLPGCRGGESGELGGLHGDLGIPPFTGVMRGLPAPSGAPAVGAWDVLRLRLCGTEGSVA